jgi:MarR family transcriptional regulator, negative regulator of the multidrug operon emrRAB
MHVRSTRDRNLIGAFALAAGDAMRRAAEVEVGQSGAAAGALITIGAYGGRSIEHLRSPLGLSQPGAVRLVERLESGGWIERRPSPGRAAALHLTAAGEALVERVLAARAAALDELLAPLAEEDVAAMAAAANAALAAATTDRAALERLCRLCERGVCDACPVAGALHARVNAARDA